MATNDQLFPDRRPKHDTREWRTCLQCEKEYPLEHFPIQPYQEKARGIRIHTCTYCHGAIKNVKRGDPIDWRALADDPDDIIPPVTIESLKERLKRRTHISG